MSIISETMDMKNVVKHLANGTLNDSLCVVCLLPFTDETYENIFTAICKKDEEYCIADVLKEVCHLEIQDTDCYKICLDCFRSASIGYRFYLQAKQSYEVLNFYTDQLLATTKDLRKDIPEEDSNCVLCIPLPKYTPETPAFEYGLDGIGQRNIGDDESEYIDENISQEEKVLLIIENENVEEENEIADEINSGSEDDNVLMIVNEKTRKKREPMASISCMHCPVRYRFLSKLKDHVKKVHDVDIYYCKICKLITDNKANYSQHVQTHIGSHQCSHCPAVFRKQESLLAHLKGHDQAMTRLENLTSGNMCEICGVVFPDADSLAAHAIRHERAHTCFYCGRMYKVQSSFEAHIKKHEALLKNKNKQQIKEPEQSSTTPNKEEESNNSKRSICGECGKMFVDERALLWHQRLHNNDRPFVCDICGRGFISLNRRNQHAMCAHSKPSRRCPLCPALFHLTSMVNSHLKRVHLNKQQKRRSRAVKHPNVFWKTETVPIQELNVSIQNELLEMQTELDIDWSNLKKQPVATKPLKLAKKPQKQNPTENTKHLYTPVRIKHELTDGIIMQEQLEFNYEFVDEEMI